MSMHKIPLSELERLGLEKHRLPIGKPSQNADCFRSGVQWATSQRIKENPLMNSIPDQLAILEKCVYSHQESFLTNVCTSFVEEFDMDEKEITLITFTSFACKVKIEGDFGKSYTGFVTISDVISWYESISIKGEQ